MIYHLFFGLKLFLARKTPPEQKSPNPNRRHLGRPEGAARPFAIFGDLADEAGLHRFRRWGHMDEIPTSPPCFFCGEFLEASNHRSGKR